MLCGAQTPISRHHPGCSCCKHSYHDEEEDHDCNLGENKSRRESHAKQLMDEMLFILGRGPVPADIHIVHGSEILETDVPPLPVVMAAQPLRV
jgi:hypothetical protein